MQCSGPVSTIIMHETEFISEEPIGFSTNCSSSRDCVHQSRSFAAVKREASGHPSVAAGG